MKENIEVIIKTQQDKLLFCVNPVNEVRVVECCFYKYHSCKNNCAYSKMIDNYANLIHNAGRSLEVAG